MFVPEFFMWLLYGFACYGLLCLLEEFICWRRDKHCKRLSIRLVLLFHDNEETVEWFVRRLHKVLRIEGKARIKEVLLVDIDSQDHTPGILERLSDNHHLFHYVAADHNSLLSKAGNSLVVDCRQADWAECLKRIRVLLTDWKSDIV
jgi:hypothetical protein